MATPALIAYEGAELAPLLPMVPEMYKDTKWAARKIGKAGRKFVSKRRKSAKAKKPRHTFGDHPTKTHNQTAQPVTQTFSTIQTRTLYSGDLIDINRATDHEANLRNFDTIHLKGIKLNMNVRNSGDTPLYFNYAVVVPKYDQSSATVSTIDFFRSNLNGRGRDFDTTLNALELHHQPINTDKYHVLFHKRIELGTLGGANYERYVLPSHRTMSKYLKIDRQIRFENNNPVNGRVQYVYWCDKFNGANGTVAAATANFGQYNVVYFKDPK